MSRLKARLIHEHDYQCQATRGRGDLNAAEMAGWCLMQPDPMAAFRSQAPTRVNGYWSDVREYVARAMYEAQTGETWED